MTIVERNIDDLIFAEYNPRQLTKEQHKHLTDSLKRFGVVDPIIVNQHKDRKDIIIGGHQRARIWKELGNTTIPTVEEKLPLDKEKELNVRLNKNVGEFDFDMLANNFEIEDLKDWGFGDEDGFLDMDNLTDGFTLPDGDKEPFQQMTFTLADEQAEQIKNAIADIKQTEEYKYCETMGNENSNGNALYLIAMQWAEQRTYA